MFLRLLKSAFIGWATILGRQFSPSSSTPLGLASATYVTWNTSDACIQLNQPWNSSPFEARDGLFVGAVEKSNGQLPAWMSVTYDIDKASLPCGLNGIANWLLINNTLYSVAGGSLVPCAIDDINLYFSNSSKPHAYNYRFRNDFDYDFWWRGSGLATISQFENLLVAAAVDGFRDEIRFFNLSNPSTKVATPYSLPTSNASIDYLAPLRMLMAGETLLAARGNMVYGINIRDPHQPRLTGLYPMRDFVQTMCLTDKNRLFLKSKLKGPLM